MLSDVVLVNIKIKNILIRIIRRLFIFENLKYHNIIISCNAFEQHQ